MEKATCSQDEQARFEEMMMKVFPSFRNIIDSFHKHPFVSESSILGSRHGEWKVHNFSEEKKLGDNARNLKAKNVKNGYRQYQATVKDSRGVHVSPLLFPTQRHSEVALSKSLPRTRSHWSKTPRISKSLARGRVNWVNSRSPVKVSVFSDSNKV